MGTLTAGNYTFTSSGRDPFLIKYNSNNEVEWAINPDVYGHTIESVKITADNGFIVGVKNGGNLCYLVKYTTNNEVEWSTYYNTSSTVSLNDIEEMSNGKYLVAGSFSGIRMPGLTNIGGDDAFLLRYSADGNLEWGTSIGGYYADAITSIMTNEDGSYIVGGYFSGESITVGDYTLINKSNIPNSYRDAFLIKYNNNDEIEWVKSFGETGSDEITAVSATGDGGYLVGGSFGSNMTIEGFSLTKTGGSDAFLVKYDNNNEVEWAKAIGGNGYETIGDILETKDGSYLVSGRVLGTTSFNCGKYLIKNGDTDRNGFLIKFAMEEIPNIYEKKTIVIGTESVNDEITAVTSIKDGGYVVGGHFRKQYPK